MTSPEKVIIMGAAGRDFHNFNTFFRDNEKYRVVAFTAAQIPNIDNRRYPPELAGRLYPEGIPILSEEKLEELIKENNVDLVVLAYSDLLSTKVIKIMNSVLAAGADFRILGPEHTMIKSSKPVIAVTASRTGAGKSTVSRKIASILKEYGLKVGVIRHPMPYGDLLQEAVQRFETMEDLERYKCTIEEREEYEQHINEGNIVYAGVDYQKILKLAEEESEIILWDGGNNDWPFIKPDLYVTVVDPLRPGHELDSFPGTVNVILADVVIINKINVAKQEDVKTVIENVRKINSKAKMIMARSEISVDKPELIRGKRVLVVEDGPTVTHGQLGYAAGYIAAKQYKAKEIIDPRPYAVGSLKETYVKYSHIEKVLPAMGYGETQMKELESTINRTPADVVVLGTPSDISRYLNINKPVVRVFYELNDASKPSLRDIILDFLHSHNLT
ncbi:MAG: GTPase [Thermofilum sp. ex4484_79]|nr:MAG: GTPase [Thermofilum sp. ex4484_79]